VDIDIVSIKKMDKVIEKLAEKNKPTCSTHVWEEIFLIVSALMNQKQLQNFYVYHTKKTRQYLKEHLKSIVIDVSKNLNKLITSKFPSGCILNFSKKLFKTGDKPLSNLNHIKFSEFCELILEICNEKLKKKKNLITNLNQAEDTESPTAEDTESPTMKGVEFPLVKNQKEEDIPDSWELLVDL